MPFHRNRSHISQSWSTNSIYQSIIFSFLNILSFSIKLTFFVSFKIWNWFCWYIIYISIYLGKIEYIRVNWNKIWLKNNAWKQLTASVNYVFFLWTKIIINEMNSIIGQLKQKIWNQTKLYSLVSSILKSSFQKSIFWVYFLIHLIF